ncbi:MAG TPA: hypothetical protein VEL77_10000 [Rugosimonospora sp.]|nr:hypothetical protein [Rugosimonospora sp.]
MQDLAFFVLPDFIDHGVQASGHPAYCQELLRNVGPAIEPIGLREQFANLFKPDTAMRIRPEAFAFPEIEAEAHLI